MPDSTAYTLQGGPSDGAKLNGLIGGFIKIPYLASNGVKYHVYERASDSQFHYTRSSRRLIHHSPPKPIQHRSILTTFNAY